MDRKSDKALRDRDSSGKKESLSESVDHTLVGDRGRDTPDYLEMQVDVPDMKGESGVKAGSKQDPKTFKSSSNLGQEIGFFNISLLAVSSRSKLDLRETRLLVTVGAPSVEESCSQAVVMSSFLFRFRRALTDNAPNASRRVTAASINRAIPFSRQQGRPTSNPFAHRIHPFQHQNEGSVRMFLQRRGER
ncbi:hypothetical protein QYF36_000050 [Acer negundo]|nr:hypothetical protein QYF36_000050 [Acer negundo]